MPDRMLVDGLSLAVAHPDHPGRVTPPILLVHGWLAGAWVWEEAQRELAARGYTSYALDLRGHGESAPVVDVGKVPFAAYVEDALRIAHDLRGRTGRTPAVIGHSMGGLIALKLAEADAVAAAALICPAPPRGIPLIGAHLARRMTRHLPAMLASRPVRLSARDTEELIFNRAADAELRAAMHARLVAGSGHAARDMLLGVPVDASRIRCPLLMVTASDDHFIPPRLVRQMAVRYRATFREYFGHGHFLLGEPQWPVVLQEIEHWLDQALRLGGHDTPGKIRLQELSHLRGREVTLAFRDGHVVQAKVVSVDFEEPPEIIYEVHAVMEVGPPHLADVKPGRVAAAPLEEIRDFSLASSS